MTRVQTSLLAVVALLAPSARVAAQDVPVVFVHGFGSSGATWQATAARLQSSLAIRAETPSLSWNALYESQANELQERVGGLASDVIGVGHSNGGLVTRQWSRQHPVSGIVTVGTPHRGAPAVTNFYAYAGFNERLLGSFNDVFRSFASGCCSWQWILWAYGTYWDAAASLAANSLLRVGTAVALNTAFPVTPEMMPNSSFLNSLNSQANLAREAAQIRVRTGIVSTAHNFYWGGVLRAAFPDDGDTVALWRDVAMYGMFAAASAIYGSAPFEDSFAFDLAGKLLNAAYYLSMMDTWWCETVSWVGGGQCWVNDTIVPQWSQVYPNGLTVDVGFDGPAHTQETRLSDPVIEWVLTNYLGVPRRGGAPPSSSSSAEMYEHAGFGGGSFSASGDMSFVGWDWNDQISSVHVPPGHTVVLYEHSDFGGQSLTLTGDAPDLRDWPGPGPDGTWNDVASSISVQ